jgi:hypothetical protein
MSRTHSKNRYVSRRGQFEWLLVGACLAAASVAHAENCARPDLEAAFPDDGASDVPLNATLSAVYGESADYLGEPVTLSSQGMDTSVGARFDPAERRLVVEQPALSANTTYSLAWPALRGLATAGHGIGKTVAFSTGDHIDMQAPQFAGIQSLSWDLVHPRDACTDDLEPRLRFRLELGAASDDGGRDSLSLLLFQTRGESLRDATPRFVAARTLPPGNHSDVELTVDDAGGRICFAAIVRDLVGNVSATGSDTRCVQTTAPPIFYGCEFSTSPRAGNAFQLFVVAFAASLFARRRRRAL